MPRAAVQAVGDRKVVYVPAEDESGRFVERTVKLSATAEEAVEVLDGLRPGELIVTAGSFFLRAEAGGHVQADNARLSPVARFTL
jgi:membrane fusion protein, heavy metal efflux system